MDQERFRDWFTRVDDLTPAQRQEVSAALSGRPQGEDALAAIELGVDDERRCPHCASAGAVSRGKARGLRRYRCKACGKTFGALTGTALSGLHYKERWLSFGEALAEGETIVESAERCGIAPSTAFRWRHRFLKAVRQLAPQPDQGLPATLPGHCHKIPRQLPAVVSSHRTRRPPAPESLPDRSHGKTMPTICELSLTLRAWPEKNRLFS